MVRTHTRNCAHTLIAHTRSYCAHMQLLRTHALIVQLPFSPLGLSRTASHTECAAGVDCFTIAFIRHFSLTPISNLHPLLCDACDRRLVELGKGACKGVVMELHETQAALAHTTDTCSTLHSHNTALHLEVSRRALRHMMPRALRQTACLSYLRLYLQ